MLKSLLLILVCLALLGLSARLLYRGLRQPGTQRVLERLTRATERVVQKSSWVALDRAFACRPGAHGAPGAMADTLGAGGFAGRGGRLGRSFHSADAAAAVSTLYIGWRYQRRLKRMIEQLPSLLDHACAA
jgi:tight adherence protein B